MRWVARSLCLVLAAASAETASAQEDARPRVDQIVREFPFPAPDIAELNEVVKPKVTAMDVELLESAESESRAELCPCPGESNVADSETVAFNRAVDEFAHTVRAQLIDRERARFDLEAQRQVRLLAFTRQLELERQREIEEQFNSEVDRFLRKRAFMADLARQRSPTDASHQVR